MPVPDGVAIGIENYLFYVLNLFSYLFKLTLHIYNQELGALVEKRVIELEEKLKEQEPPKVTEELVYDRFFESPDEFFV